MTTVLNYYYYPTVEVALSSSPYMFQRPPAAGGAADGVSWNR